MRNFEKRVIQVFVRAGAFGMCFGVTGSARAKISPSREQVQQIATML